MPCDPQILRNAASLAAVTGRALTVHSIRANRSNPGLRPQHLTGMELVARICEGRLDGAAVSSTRITLVPKGCAAGQYAGDTGTAGSCTLLAQAAVPALVLARRARGPGGAAGGGECTLELRGGTDADMAPPVGYLQHVLAPTLHRILGLDLQVLLRRRGFYPKGGGVVECRVTALPPGAALPPIQMTDRGSVMRVWGEAYVAGRLPKRAGQGMLDAAAKRLRAGLPPAAALELSLSLAGCEGAAGDGAGVILVATTSTGCLLGVTRNLDRGVRGEVAGAQAADQLLAELAHGGCVDEHLQDQLVIFMAMAAGESRVVMGEPSLHTRTAIDVAQALTPARFEVANMGDGKWAVTCRGAGLRAPPPL